MECKWEAGNCLNYLARYVFKVAIAESRINSADDTHVSFTYRKVHSHRTRTMRLPIFAFLHRFLQHVLPSGLMRSCILCGVNRSQSRRHAAVEL